VLYVTDVQHDYRVASHELSVRFFLPAGCLRPPCCAKLRSIKRDEIAVRIGVQSACFAARCGRRIDSIRFPCYKPLSKNSDGCAPVTIWESRGDGAQPETFNN